MSQPAYNPDATDLDRLHPAVKREKADLAPGAEPAPMWVIFVGFIVAIVGGGSINKFSTGGFDFENSNPLMYAKMPDPRPIGDGPGAVLDPMQLAMKGGATTYGTCAGCHQASGSGVPGVYPQLAGSDWVTGGTERLARVILHAVAGPLKISGKDFNSVAQMTPQGATLGDKDIANVMTYIRNSWGNTGSMVTKEQVAAVREKEKARTSPWTQAELQPYATKDIPGGEAPPAAK